VITFDDFSSSLPAESRFLLSTSLNVSLLQKQTNKQQASVHHNVPDRIWRYS